MNNKVLVGVSLLSGILLGSVGGFFAGVGSTQMGQSFLEGMTSNEEAADVTHSKTLKRKGFSLQVPANWKVDIKDASYDPDNVFSINSPGHSYTSFVIFNVEAETKAFLDEEVTAQLEMVKNAVKKPFTQWGNLKGHGIDLKGRVVGVAPGGVRIFAHASAGRTLMITEQYYDDDLSKTQPGFKLIESSFKLNSSGVS